MDLLFSQSRLVVGISSGIQIYTFFADVKIFKSERSM